MANFCTKCGNPLYLCTCEDKKQQPQQQYQPQQPQFQPQQQPQQYPKQSKQRERDRFAQSAASPLKNASATKEPILI